MDTSANNYGVYFSRTATNHISGFKVQKRGGGLGIPSSSDGPYLRITKVTRHSKPFERSTGKTFNKQKTRLSCGDLLTNRPAIFVTISS